MIGTVKDHLKTLEIRSREVLELSLALDFLSDVARLAEQAAEVDPEDKEGLLFASRRVQNAFSTILDVLHTHAMWISEDLGHLHYKLEKSFRPKTHNPGPEDEEDINSGAGCED